MQREGERKERAKPSLGFGGLQKIYAKNSNERAEKVFVEVFLLLLCEKTRKKFVFSTI